jgi:S-adenosylmethionine/arginine decarboxylase-like enzyme
MCGACQPQRALEVLEAALQPAARSIRTVPRGQL